MPRVPEGYFDARRDQILETASQLVAEKGFSATQMREVAEGAGLSTGAVYRYFASKEELFRAMIDRERPSEATLRKRVLGDGQPSERLAALPAQFVALSEESEELSRKRFRGYGEAATIPYVGQMLREAVTEVIDDVEALVREGQASGDLNSSLDPRMTATAVATLRVAIDFAWLFDERFDGPRLAEALQIMVSALREDSGA
jgi:AcrR family transcriptional regulator